MEKHINSRVTILLVSIGISGCSTLQSSNNIVPTNFATSNIKVKISSAKYQTSEQLEKYNGALVLTEKVINSREFELAVLEGPETQHTVVSDSEKQTKKCSDTDRSTYSFNQYEGACYTNRDVYKKLQKVNWELEVKVNPRWWALWCAFPFVREEGHREGNLIVTQECKFEKMTTEFLAGHLIHEYLHVLGFGHPYDKYNNRKYTIPYYVGDKAVEILNRI